MEEQFCVKNFENFDLVENVGNNGNSKKDLTGPFEESQSKSNKSLNSENVESSESKISNIEDVKSSNNENVESSNSKNIESSNSKISNIEDIKSSNNENVESSISKNIESLNCQPDFFAEEPEDEIFNQSINVRDTNIDVNFIENSKIFIEQTNSDDNLIEQTNCGYNLNDISDSFIKDASLKMSKPNLVIKEETVFIEVSRTFKPSGVSTPKTKQVHLIFGGHKGQEIQHQSNRSIKNFTKNSFEDVQSGSTNKVHLVFANDDDDEPSSNEFQDIFMEGVEYDSDCCPIISQQEPATKSTPTSLMKDVLFDSDGCPITQQQPATKSIPISLISQDERKTVAKEQNANVLVEDFAEQVEYDSNGRATQSSSSVTNPKSLIKSSTATTKLGKKLNAKKIQQVNVVGLEEKDDCTIISEHIPVLTNSPESLIKAKTLANKQTTDRIAKVILKDVAKQVQYDSNGHPFILQQNSLSTNNHKGSIKKARIFVLAKVINSSKAKEMGSDNNFPYEDLPTVKRANIGLHKLITNGVNINGGASSVKLANTNLQKLIQSGVNINGGSSTLKLANAGLQKLIQSGVNITCGASTVKLANAGLQKLIQSGVNITTGSSTVKLANTSLHKLIQSGVNITGGASTVKLANAGLQKLIQSGVNITGGASTVKLANVGLNKLIESGINITGGSSTVKRPNSGLNKLIESGVNSIGGSSNVVSAKRQSDERIPVSRKRLKKTPKIFSDFDLTSAQVNPRVNNRERKLGPGVKSGTLKSAGHPVKSKKKPGGNEVKKNTRENGQSNQKDDADLHYACDCCDKRYSTMKSLRAHLVTYHRWTFKQAEKVCQNPVGINLDSLIEGPGEKKMEAKKQPDQTFLCEKCPKVLSSIYSLRNHISLVHEKVELERKYQCEQCPKAFTAPSNLKHHQFSAHLNVTPFKCHKCPSQFKHKQALVRHVSTVHDKARDFLCPTCNKGFTSMDIVRRHIVSVHEKGTPFKCQLCPEAFRWAEQRRLHLRSKHNKGKPLTSREQTYLKRRNDLLRHGELQGKESLAPTCHHCLKKFHSQSELERHIQIEHTMEKPYKCPHCPAAFFSQTSMLRHVGEEHLPDKSQKTECPHCCKKYFNFYIDTHIKSVHMKQRPFACPQCPRMFGHKNDVGKHVLVKHSKESKFECNTCKRKFGTKQHLNQHTLAVHSESMSYFCTECPKVFRWESCLYIHNQKCHRRNDKTSNASAQGQTTQENV